MTKMSSFFIQKDRTDKKVVYRPKITNIVVIP